MSFNTAFINKSDSLHNIFIVIKAKHIFKKNGSEIIMGRIKFNEQIGKER
jgi:hypothetical protein